MGVCSFVACGAVAFSLAAQAFAAAPSKQAEGPEAALPYAPSEADQHCFWAGDGYWSRRHRAKLLEIGAGPKEYVCVFVGDSITHNWEGWTEEADRSVAQRQFEAGVLKFPVGPGRRVWDELRRDYRVLNLGMAGDTTREVLWRLDHGEMEGYRTRLVMLMIGTNNGHSAPDIAAGIAACVRKIRAKQPQATVLLSPIFPSKSRPDDPRRLTLETVNGLIRPLADGRSVVWLDINAKLLEADGTLSPRMMPDFLHPLERGYEIWRAALEPYLRAAAAAAKARSDGCPRVWQAQWIMAPDCLHIDWRSKDLPAPVFARRFAVTNVTAGARLAICGLGYFHCLLDGREVTDAELVPAPTAYDRRWRYRVFALPPLAAGEHELRVEVGDGLYRCTTPDLWHFDKASWLDYPKLLCELEDAEGRLLLKTDKSWRVRHGPTVHTALRGGETYDARREKDGDWRQARLANGPGGRGEEETMPPCRIVATHEMRPVAGTAIYDAGVNLAGVPRLTVRGSAGAKVTVWCDEALTADGTNLLGAIRMILPDSPDFQRDEYILRGGGVETWRPRFTYHGFRYAKVAVEGDARLERLEALEINTDFANNGSFRTSDGTLCAVGRKALRAVRSNFVGIPTDCPHREKNGWFSEARLQNETLLYECDAASAIRAFVDMALDLQRPCGQLPNIAPSPGWGYSWCTGPTYESGPYLMAEQVYRFTGDASALLGVRECLLRNLAFQETLLDERGVLDIESSLGDWMAPELDRMRTQEVPRVYSDWAYPEATNAPRPYLQTAFYKRLLDLAAEIAALDGRPCEAAELAGRARRTAEALQAAYGVPNTTTCLALALECGLCRPAERQAVLDRLVGIVRANRHRVDFGTIGSGCVLRALFENGCADDAYRMMVQPDYPGYGYLAANAELTAFPEQWSIRDESRNHGAFSDVVACMYRYLAGIRHVSERPGRNFVEIRPCIPGGLADFSATHEGYSVSWRKVGAQVEFEVLVPEGKRADFIFAGARRPLEPGRHVFSQSASRLK